MKPEVITAKRQEMAEFSDHKTVTLKIEDDIAIMKIDLPNAKVSYIFPFLEVHLFLLLIVSFFH